MGIAGSLLTCLKIAMSAGSLSLGVLYLLIDVLKFVFKVAVLLAMCYVMLSMMEGKVDIHVETNGVRFHPLKFIRDKLHAFSGQPMTESEPIQEVKDTGKRKTTEPPPQTINKQFIVDDEQEETTPKPKETKSFSRIVRAVIDYFVPG
jgi:hypothetical protein